MALILSSARSRVVKLLIKEFPLTKNDTLTCLSEIRKGCFIHGEETNGGSVLGAHVGNGSPVCDGKSGHAGTKELDKFSNNTNLPQMLQNKIIKQ